jgi:transposase-like protein
MKKTRRLFTPEEKLSILQESEREGFTETCRRHNLASSVLRYWKKKYLDQGKDGLKSNYKRVDPQLRELLEENERLKRLIAKQAIELEFKTELIKKNQAHLHKGKRWF